MNETPNLPSDRCGQTHPHGAHSYLRSGGGAHCSGVAIRLGGSPHYPAPTIDPTTQPAPVVLNAPRTDPATERMRQETGHDCIACPSDVRNLMATAHNLLVKLDASDWAGVARKKQAVREALARLQPVADAHFDALDAWRRP